MRNIFKSGLSALAIITAMALPAKADLTAPQVRDALFSYYEAFGYQVATSSEDYVNGTLVVREMTLNVPIPDDDVIISVTVEEFTLIENNDGSVDFRVPDLLPMYIDIAEDGEVGAEIVMEMASTEMKGRASGDLDNIRIETSADATSIRVKSLMVEGENLPLTVVMATGPLDSDYTIRKLDDDVRDISGDYEIEAVDITANVAEPDGDGFFSMTASIGDMAMEFASILKVTDDPKDMLAAGFDIDATMEFGPTSIDMNFRDGDDRFAGSSSAASSTFGFKLSKDEMGYTIATKEADVLVSGSEIPLPQIKFSYDELVFDFNVPLSQGDGPRDFYSKTALRDFEMAEALWSIFDPSQQLPRDPVTVALDISGKVIVLLDLLAPENIDKLDDLDGPPMLPVSVNLNELLISAAGAMATGNGRVEFDFTNPNTIAGFPAPQGSFTFNVKGAFGLMDKLVTMGLLPEDASMGFRAMLGAFSKPIGEDHLESVIELGADGSIKANGQRIQ